MSRCWYCQKNLGGSNCVSGDMCEDCYRNHILKKASIELIRFSPKELNVDDILLTIQGYGTDNTSLYNSDYDNHTEQWKINIFVEKIEESEYKEKNT